MNLEEELEVSPQRVRGLERANSIRAARADLKRLLRSGEADVLTVLADAQPEVSGMTLAALLASQHGWGRMRTLALLRRVGLNEDKTIGSLTERQRNALSNALTPTASPDVSA